MGLPVLWDCPSCRCLIVGMVRLAAVVMTMTLLMPAFQVQFLRASLKGRSENYEEVTLVDAFKTTVAQFLVSHAVTFVEEDVVGTKGHCYRQNYYYAQVNDADGEPNGEGSLRCLMTKVASPAVRNADG